jgi:hypothetical protein
LSGNVNPSIARETRSTGIRELIRARREVRICATDSGAAGEAEVGDHPAVVVGELADVVGIAVAAVEERIASAGGGRSEGESGAIRSISDRNIVVRRGSGKSKESSRRIVVAILGKGRSK